MAADTSLYLDPRFDLLRAQERPSIIQWPSSRCPRCQTRLWIPRAYCSQCHAALGLSQRAIHEAGRGCPGFHKIQGSLSDLQSHPPSLNLALGSRFQRVLEELALVEDTGPWSLFVDERAAFAAGELKEVSSDAGSERHFHLRHPWLTLRNPKQQVTLIQGFHLYCVKRYQDRHVVVAQSHSPRFELLYEDLSAPSKAAAHSLEKESEEEILGELRRILSDSSASHDLQARGLTSFPRTLARRPQLKEVYERARVAATMLVMASLLTLIILGPVRRHLEIYRLARSLEGGPKVKHVDRLVELGKDEPPSLDVALKSSDSWAKNNALAALKGMNHPEAIAESLRLSKDPSPIVRHQALMSLAGLDARQELRDIVTNKGRLDIRQYAIRSLAELKDQAFAKKALQLISKKDLAPDIRVELLCALPAVYQGSRAGALKVIEKILRDKTEPAPVRHAAVFSHLNCGGDAELIAQTLSKLVQRVRANPKLIKTERLTLRAAIHGLRASPKIHHQDLLKSIEKEPWLGADLLRIVRRSLRPPSKF
ncbi:MAG: HEAT repeat domain-containing protein [Planctomycetota bacterium]|nr:HEAT repeat domain-containing protein [Planctomycetota bacterium]